MDLVIRGAMVVQPEGLRRADIAIAGETIAEVAPEFSGRGGTEISAKGCVVLPGQVDAHVHFNEPGRAEWEGLATGSRALAAGGGTCFFDMPLNSDPPVLDAETFETKRRLAEKKSVLDFGLWGGLCPGHVGAIEEMAECGAVGFKAFLCDSGIAEFPAADPATLREGMKRAQRTGLPVAVHAEDPAVLEAARPGVAGRSLRDFFASRPKEAEVAAVRHACELAGETGCKLHVVHVSCAEALAEISRARAAGVDVTAETCPHYLLFDADQAVRLGARAKCAPPLREAGDVENLWTALLGGAIQTIGSDHSPAPPERKGGGDFFAIWGGIAGCQHAWPGFLAALHERDRLSLAEALGARHVTERFGLAKSKGRIAAGFDADLAIVRFGPVAPVMADQLLYRHPFSLYEGSSMPCAVESVIRRGEVIVRQGAPVASAGRGKFFRPER